jgi:hypothetical protein
VLVVVEADVAEGVAGGGVDGDPVVVADGGDLGAGPAGADVDAQGAQVDGAVGADGQGVDGGVVLAGQVAGAAVGGGGVPGGLGGGLDRGVVAAGVVVVAVGVQQGLQLVQGGGGGLGGEPALEGLVVAFDLAAGLRLTGQSRLILWITSGRGGRELPGFAAGAFEAADGFLVAADLGGDGFEAAAQLVDLDDETGQGGGVAAAGAVLLDDGAQVGPAVEGGPADPRAGGCFGERDGLPGRGELGAGGLDPGLLVVVSWHGPG